MTNLIMKDKELAQAADALINWFQSQDITPADGGIIMAKVLASALVTKTENVAELSCATESFKLLLLIEIAAYLRQKGK